MYKIYKAIVLLLFVTGLQAQDVGDTLRVKVFDFNSQTRDTVIDFPTLPDDVTFEKILLKYTMRCHDGLVNPGDNSQGCGEWDFSCNTYLVDSTKIETVPNTITSHYITNTEDLVLNYKATPVYDYLRGVQNDVSIINTISETEVSVGGSGEQLVKAIHSQNIIGKSQYLYTASELLTAGLVAGPIQSLSLSILDQAGEADYLTINVKHTEKEELDGLIDFDGFTTVYEKNTVLIANQDNRFDFESPFNWDGESNILVEFHFTNLENDNTIPTVVEGEMTSGFMSATSTNEQEFTFANNSYLQAESYLGIPGSSHRTIEAWVKTTNGANGEIMAWGSIITGRKWVFRFNNGALRAEVHGGGSNSTTLINDGEWHHVALVFDGTTVGDVKFYVDGVLDPHSATGSTLVDTRESPVRISRGLNNRYLDAEIDDIRLWDIALDQETIASWRHRKLDDSHPSYDNLQLHYDFSEQGKLIMDQSGNGRNMQLIGGELRDSHMDGATLFKDFELHQNRPMIHFYQGEYETMITEVEVDKPILKEPRHFVVERTIVSGDPNAPFDDEILEPLAYEVWSLDQTIYDENTGDIIEENTLNADGTIEITDLEYFRRFPYYNELVSFVTPYGFFLDLGQNGETWYMDMSDYAPILNGKRRMLMTLGGQNNEEYDMEFQFIVGTPPRDVVQYDQVWQGTNRIGIARIDQILDDTKFAPYSLPLAADAESFKLKSSITGHGVQGEFGQNGGAIFHSIDINNEPIFIWDIEQECSFNPIFPQGGTWVYDRQGWCPGEQTFMNEQDFTEVAEPGSNLLIEYSTSDPSNASGDYRYHVAHQVVGYGPANFQLDASIMRITAPNNTAEYKRTGTICTNPTIVIRNTGATDLTELTINYWLNESITPQTFTWTGDLEFMEEEEVELPANSSLWFDVLEEGNVFHAEIQSPNQSNDEYSYNNTMSSAFDLPEVYDTDISIEIRTNFFASENNYQLLDEFGDVVISNSLPLASTTYTDELDLDEGCYKLVVVDAGGDGLQWWANSAQGTGFARIRASDGTLLKNFEPDFGGGFEYEFNTIFPISVEDLNFLTSIKIYPNPTTDFVTLEVDDIEETNVSIIDVLGQSYGINGLSNGNGTMNFDLTGLNAGIYFVLIEKGELLTTRKIVVE